MQRIRWAAWKQVKQSLIPSNGCAISSKSQSCASQSLWERSIVTVRPYSASSEGKLVFCNATSMLQSNTVNWNGDLIVS